MSERFSNVFSLTRNLYAEGSPVVIVAGALLKDAKTKKVLAQLKIRNIGSSVIKALTVSVAPFDTVGNSLGEPVIYQYLDLQIHRNEEFGTQTPIYLPDSNTRTCTVAVTEVVFADNSIRTVNSNNWEPLEEPQQLNAVLREEELVRQYCLQFGEDCSYFSTSFKDLWYCACGALNCKNDKACYACCKTAEQLLSVDLQVLKQDCDARLQAELIRLQEEKEAEEARLQAEREKTEAERAANEAKQKKLKKILAIILPSVAAFVAFLVFVIIPASKYNKALDLLMVGNYLEAISAFEAIDGYKDSAEKRDTAYRLYIVDEISKTRAGDSFELGKYEQDGIESNGTEDIEWIVLDKQDDKVLVISKSALDFVEYNVTHEDMTWEECTLRTWLNSDFFDLAFNDFEKSLIPVTTVPVDENPAYDTVYGNSTQDKIFVLSKTEAEKYFSSNEERDCVYTDYAVSKLGGGTIYGWWLRTTGKWQTSVAFIAGDGGIIGNGENYIQQDNGRLVSAAVDSKAVAVRPAMWIDLVAIQ